MTKHTQGPWHINGEWIDAKDSEPICFIPTEATYSDREANKRLIAAAPDQNAALISGAKALYMAIDKICTLTGGKYDDQTSEAMLWFQKELNAMNAAIAKAKGE